jgi:glyoxylase I family protein
LAACSFGARDLKALALWYRAHLGVDVVPDNYDDTTWSNRLVNFRVSNREAMVLQLKSAGFAVDVDPERYPDGRLDAAA